jgi:hypothetical protein
MTGTATLVEPLVIWGCALFGRSLADNAPHQVAHNQETIRSNLATRAQRAITRSMVAQRSLVVIVALALSNCRQDPPLLGPHPAAVSTEQSAQKVESVRITSADLEGALQRLRRLPGKYQAPNEGQRGPFQRWVAHLVTSAESGNLPVLPAPAGFTGKFVDGGRVWLLAEDESATKTGAGAYALRPDATNELVIQAPHTFFDQGTLPLALTLFDQLDARVLMINTLHRGGSAAGEESEDERLERARSGKEDADLAHQTNSYYQVAHHVFGAQWPQARFVQLHGFRDEKLPGVSVVVSAANTRLDALPVVRALNNGLGAGTARLFPEEVGQLGGIINEQARACKDAGWQFLHLEISASLRQRMERQPAVREQFAQALKDALLLR